MKFRLSFLLLLISVVAFGQYSGKYAEGMLEVQFASNSNHTNSTPNAQYIEDPNTPMNRLFEKYGVTEFKQISKRFPELYAFYWIRFTETEKVDEFIEELHQLGKFASINKVPVPRINAEAKPPELELGKTWYIDQVFMNESWKWRNQGVYNVKIAVVDVGIRTSHEDLVNRIWRNPLEIPGNGIDDDNNGYIDDIHGYDVADDDPDPNPPLDLMSKGVFGHGTMVAGLCSADPDNEKGIAGIGINSWIIPVKGTKDIEGDGNVLWGWQGIEYAIAAGADIVNCSWSQEVFTDYNQRVLDLAKAHNVIIVASAGNDYQNYLVYPAAADYVIAVGATSNNDKIWDKSNYGSFIDVMAPGTNIYTTGAGSDGDYVYGNGTSFSAPLVSGYLAFMLSIKPSKELALFYLKQGCDNIDIDNPGYEGKLGAGRIRIDRTIEWMLYNNGPKLPNAVKETRLAELKVYPNPSNGSLFLEEGEFLELQVLDLSGKEVVRMKPMSREADFRVYGLKGLYILRIRTTDGEGIARVHFQ